MWTQKVAHKYGYMIVPHRIDRRAATTHRRAVDHIIVYQRGVVQQLDRRCSAQHLVRHRAEKPGAQHHYYGADKLALSLQIVGNHVIHQRIGRGQLFGYERIEPVNVGCYFLSYFSRMSILRRKFTNFSRHYDRFPLQTFKSPMSTAGYSGLHGLYRHLYSYLQPYRCLVYRIRYARFPSLGIAKNQGAHRLPLIGRRAMPTPLFAALFIPLFAPYSHLIQSRFATKRISLYNK